MLELFIKQLEDFHFLLRLQTFLKTEHKIVWTVKLSNIARDFLAYIA